MSEEIMIKDLNEIPYEGLDVKDVSHYSNGTINSITDADGKIDMTKNIVEINVKNKKIQKIASPVNVLQAMKTWFYIYKRETPFEIVAVHVLFNRKGVIAQIQQCVVTKADFVEIYDKVNKDGVSESDLIKRMSEMWIEKNNYKQWWADPE